MKSKISLCLIALFCFSGIPKGSLIKWESNRNLSWDDFKGKPDVYSDAVAMTFYSIAFSAENVKGEEVLIVKVEAFFDPMRSWVRKKRIKDDALSSEKVLKHEQVHFDIAELFARKLRKELKEKTIQKENVNTELAYLHNEIYKRLEKRQELYDNETEHSIDTEKQLKWEERIQKELEELKGYASSEVLVYLN